MCKVTQGQLAHFVIFQNKAKQCKVMQRPIVSPGWPKLLQIPRLWKELPAQPLCQYHDHFVKLLSSNYPMRNENGNFLSTAKDTISLSSQLRPLRAPNSQNAARSEASVFSGPLIFFLLFSLRKLSTWIIEKWQCKCNFQSKFFVLQMSTMQSSIFS